MSIPPLRSSINCPKVGFKQAGPPLPEPFISGGKKPFEFYGYWPLSVKWISFADQLFKSNFHKCENGSLWVFLKHQLFTQTVGHDTFYGRGDENGKYDYDDSGGDDLDDDLSVCLFVKFYPLTLKTPKNVPA